MKLKKVLLLMGCVMMSVGCSSSSSQTSKMEELYKGLEAKETYEKVCDYFNENVHYFKRTVELVNPETNQCSNKMVEELYNVNGEHSYVSKQMMYSDGKATSGFATVLSKDDIYMMGTDEEMKYVRTYFSDEEKEYFLNDYYTSAQHDFLTPVQDSDTAKITSLTREDKDNEIVLELKYTYTYTSEEGTTVVYYLINSHINSDGYLCKEEIKGYSDEDYKTMVSSTVVELTNMNEKESLNFEEEVNALKAIEEKTIDEGESVLLK